MADSDNNYIVPRAVRRRIEERQATGPHDVAAPVEQEILLPRRPAFDVESATRGELAAEAALRGVVVTRADGRGDPLVEDFRAALRGPQ